ncbi:hypothetical protein QEH59_09155 [Coraliomargarita sp. SDUM461004]|uniref:Uncharacterized protein n=1 Tax=Thalassobacterium sedimentorum TaxID=3041258 RepID=A0ABU1AIE9_9BACT|nr:hypothetical protein [Coraliomargarita sp. SDUM461004]MDQ8194592.1 hypothetical protein [Coraliomargarita sp. SDUM461004]
MHERDRYAGFWCRFLAMFPFFVIGGLIFPNSVLVEDPYGLFSTERVIEESVETVNHPDGSYSSDD